MASDTASREEIRELADEPPTSINPYEVLEISDDVTDEEVRRAYRKAALKYHPDKASGDDSTTAKEKFQQIAFAYAILSDRRRRKLYDSTGSTAEVLAEDDDFDWADYFRARWQDAISGNKLDAFTRAYRGSEEEKGDILKAYTRGTGDMDFIYESVMCSNVLENDEEIRKVISDAITSGEVEAYDKFIKESKSSKANRVKKAQREAQEAEREAQKKLAKDNGKGMKAGKANTTSGDPDSMDSLALMIKQRQKAREDSFFANLEEKYGNGSGTNVSKSKKGKKRGRDAHPMDEPPEEAFKATAERAKKTNRQR